MIVSNNNTLLNILLPNDNKVLKEALQNADAQTLQNLKNNNTNVSDILKNLFENLKNGDKNKNNIENILKNSTIFKELGNFSKSINSLIEQFKNEPSMQKFIPTLQSFLQDISTLDENSLKEMITKSGVFLESKALKEITSQTLLPNKLETVLNEIKSILKNIPSLEAKKIETMINNLLQNSAKQTPSTTTLQGDLKTIITNLQNLSTNLNGKNISQLNNLTNNLKEISTQAQLVESKIANNPVNSLQHNEALNLKESINLKTLNLLTQLKSELLTNNTISNSQNIVKQLDNLLSTNDIFAKNPSLVEPKNLLNQLININELKTSTNPQIKSIVTNITNIIDNIDTMEESLLKNQNITPQKNVLLNDINQTLTSLKNELLNLNNIDTKPINQIIDKLLNLQNLFSKIEIPLQMQNFQSNLLQTNLLQNNESFQSIFTSNVNSLILNLKEAVLNHTTNSENLNIQHHINKIVEKLETILHNFTKNPNILNEKNPLQNDMKAVLLQMQDELVSKNDPNTQESLKQVEKMITQIEYHQLLSSVSNTNSVYIPFLWDMLDDGSIEMKKINEEKFYCEINLSLKEFGQTNLLLSLYDKNKIDITIYASKDSFKEAIKENASKLRQALNKVNLVPMSLKIIDMQKKEETQEDKQINLYNKNDDNNFGIDIRV